MLKNSIFSKIFILTILVSLIIGVIILIVTINERTQDITEQLVQENKLLAEVAAEHVEAGYYANTLHVEMLKVISDSENVLFLWVVKPDGEVFWADEPALLGKKIDSPLAGTEKVAVKTGINPSDGGKIKLIVQPVQIREQGKPWSLFMGVSLGALSAAQKAMIVPTIYSFIPAIIFAILVAFYLSRKIIEPLEALQKGTEILGKGDFNYRLSVKTGDEIEKLGKSFNQMAESLKEYRRALESEKADLEINVKARTKELKELAESLEAEVKKRTKELEVKVQELERFRKIAVGRELKMMEFKNKIKQLKAENGKKS